VMPCIGEYTERLSMVMRSSGHISLETTLEGPEYDLQPRQSLHWSRNHRQVRFLTRYSHLVSCLAVSSRLHCLVS
jgi:hypothetical protein